MGNLYLQTKKLNQKGSLLLLLSIFLFNISAFSCTWTTTGASTNWGDAAAWTSSGSGCSGSTPDDDNINSGDVVVINHPMNLTTATFTVKSGGGLTINSTLTVTGNVVFSNNSIVTINVGATFAISGNVTNNNNSIGISIFGSVTVGGNFTGGNGSEVGPNDGSGGTLSVNGSITTDGSGSIFGSTDDCVDSATPCTITPFNPLPVELVSFIGHSSIHGVVLSWTTASEYNSSHFNLERSINGSSWELVATVEAAINSNSITEYTFTDDRPNTGTNYYRLVQVDQDGVFEIFNPITIEFNSGMGTNIIVLSPNPLNSSNDLVVSVAAEQEDNYSFLIFDAKGQVMETRTIHLTKGFNAVLIADLKLNKGIYIVQIGNEEIKFEAARLSVY